MMKLVFASDSFKGSLSGRRAGELLRMVAERVFGDCDTVIVPIAIADGGEGTLDAVMSFAGGRKETVIVHDPLGRKTEASYGILPDGAALIEMAEASGLTLLSDDEKNPLHATSFGTGELIRDVLKKSCRNTVSAGSDPFR